MINDEFKVLIIDDSPGNLTRLKALIRASFPQAEIMTARSGSKGLEMIDKFEPDIILLDIVMKGLDGLELCHRLKKDNRLSEIPVVFITAKKGDKERRIKALEAGGDAFLAKPVDECDLTAQIRAMLKIRKAAIEKQNEQVRLEKLVEARTVELYKNHAATLNLLEDLKMEIRQRKESEETYRNLFQNAQVGLFRTRISDGKMLESNEQLAKMFGYYDHEEFISEYVMSEKYVNPEDRKRMVEIISNHGYIENFEARFYRKDKSVFWIRYSARLNTKEGWIEGVVEDITERKRVEEDLKQEKDWSGNIVNNAPNIIVGLGEKSKIIVFNHYAEKLTGYKAEEVIGKEWIKIFIPEELKEAIYRVWDDIVNKKLIDHHFENAIITKTGEKRLIEWNNTILTENGEFRMILSIGQDITERRQTEEALKINTQRYQDLFKNNRDGLVVVDLDGRFLEANESFCKMLGYSLEELTAKEDFYAITPEKWRKWEHEEIWCNRLLKNGQTGVYEKEYIRKDGTIFPVELRSFTVKDEQGNILYLWGVARDITERRKAEKALLQIEWMLTEKMVKSGDFTPKYGDLTKLNKNGLILSLVGKDQLAQIASEYLDLLETSSAIYEINGDYALGLFSSGWCKLMDIASRKLCKTDDNQEALDCGKWLCHESCWREASLKAINTGKTADVECNGGIRLYAVPIRVSGKVVGAINFGYGDPPKDDAKLQKLSDLFQIPVQVLRKKGQEYQTRPQYIIDYSKKRIQSSAQYIGDIIERKQAELQLEQNLEEKNLLLRELYHRTKNNMQVILSMLRIQARISNHTEVWEVFNNISNKIKAMSLVHQKLYEAEDLSHIKLKEYIQDLLRHLTYSFNPIKDQINIEHNLEDVMVTIDKAVPLGLVLTELISNAFKHAFPEDRKGTISIDLHAGKSNKIILKISDNGVGIKDHENLREIKSMGLHNVFTIVEHQLQGQIECVTDDGITWQIILDQDIEAKNRD